MATAWWRWPWSPPRHLFCLGLEEWRGGVEQRLVVSRGSVSHVCGPRGGWEAASCSSSSCLCGSIREEFLPYMGSRRGEDIMREVCPPACMECLRSIKITLVVFHISLRFPCVRVSGDREGAVEERILGKMIRVAQLIAGGVKFLSFLFSLIACVSILLGEGGPEERTLLNWIWGLKWVVRKVLKLFLRFSLIFLFDLLVFVFLHEVHSPHTREYPWTAHEASWLLWFS